MYDSELHAMLRMSTVSRTHYSIEEMREIDAKVKAIEKLNERLKELDPKSRIYQLEGKRRRKVWYLELLDIRGKAPVFVDARCIYVANKYGTLSSLGINGHNGLTAEEMEFVARFM